MATRTDGRHRIRRLAGQRAHTENYLIGQVRNGSLDMARVDVASLASLVPMANLLALQNSYAANARVLSAVKDMLDTLVQM